MTNRPELYEIATRPVKITEEYVKALFADLIRLENDNGDTEVDRACVALRAVIADAADWYRLAEVGGNHHYHGATVLRTVGKYLFRPPLPGGEQS